MILKQQIDILSTRKDTTQFIYLFPKDTTQFGDSTAVATTLETVKVTFLEWSLDWSWLEQNIAIWVVSDNVMSWQDLINAISS